MTDSPDPKSTAQLAPMAAQERPQLLSAPRATLIAAIIAAFAACTAAYISMKSSRDAAILATDNATLLATIKQKTDRDIAQLSARGAENAAKLAAENGKLIAKAREETDKELARISRESAVRLAEIAARFTADREYASFRRTQLDWLTRAWFDASTTLFAQLESSEHVLFILTTQEQDLVKQSDEAFGRLRQVVVSLEAIGVISSGHVDRIKSLLSTAQSRWRTFASLRATYRSAVKEGLISELGHASEAAKPIEQRSIDSVRALRSALTDLTVALSTALLDSTRAVQDSQIAK